MYLQYVYGLKIYIIEKDRIQLCKWLWSLEKCVIILIFECNDKLIIIVLEYL